MVHGSGEFVFTVSESTAVSASRITLAEAGLTERAHLQEWVLAHPLMLGQNVLVITFEFNEWQSASGVQRDRLDILGLGSDGRLVVAELKRGKAPDTVEMQAIKYAAMASRFTEQLLVEYYEAFCIARSVTLGSVTALERLRGHSDVGLQPELLAQPRIVLLAEEYPPSVTATAVWLNEMGLDLTLMQYQAYRTGRGEVLVTVSQMYPVPEIGSFEVAPRSRSAQVRADAAPVVPWSTEDLTTLADIGNPATLAILDLGAQRPDQWIRASEVYEQARVTIPSGTGQLGGFGVTLRSRFGRSNPPFERKWGADGHAEICYRVGSELANIWMTIRRPPSRTDADESVQEALPESE